MSAPARWVLPAGGALALTAMLLTHPLAILACLGLTAWLVLATGVHKRSPFLLRGAAGLAVAVLLFNTLLSWNGSTVLYRAPFRIALLGRPLITAEAMAWGAMAGGQLAATVLALGAATLAAPPEALHRGMAKLGAPRSVAHAAGLALRLVPDTTRDARAMRQALRVRGVSTDGVRGASRVLVPLTARALDRAQLAEEALTLRGYDPSAPGRARGALPATALFALAGGVFSTAVAIWGPGRPGYYPVVDVPLDPASLVWLGLALAVPAALVWGVAACSR